MGTEITNAANAIMGNIEFNEKRPPQIAPLLLAILVQVVAHLITAYGPALLEKLMKNLPLGMCDKLAVKKAIRTSCPHVDDYRTHGQEIFRATIKTFPQFTPAQVTAMMREVRP